MEKTKLGLSAGVLSVIVILLFQFGGYTVGLLALGYVLLCEKDETLRVTAVTALLVSLAYSVLNMVIGLIPNIVSLFESMIAIFNGYVNLNFVHNVSNFLSIILSLARTAVYIILGVMAGLGKPILLPAVKKLLEQ